MIPVAANAPSFARGKVTAILPVDTVFTRSAVCIVNTATAVGPEFVIVAIAGPRLATGDGLAIVVFARHRHGTHDRGGSQEDTHQRWHDEGVRGN